MTDADPWAAANRALVAKALGECTYEECLDPTPTEDGGYRLDLASGVTYRFQARETPWTWLQVDPGTVRRDGEPATAAAQLLVDAAEELGLDDPALASLLEELQNTLHSEVRRRDHLEGVTAADLVDLDDARRQGFLGGHPKFLANKGRVGWGDDALRRYAPEAGGTFQLRYVAIHRDRLTLATAPGVAVDDLLAESLDADAREALRARAAERGLDLDDHLVVPVHPWQWQRYVKPQYAELAARRDLVDLGVRGDAYRPQQSIRTLSNADRPHRADVKTALTILNTSCYRGIPGDHLELGVTLSGWLSTLAGKDPVLADRDLVVLDELGGVHCPHPRQSQLTGNPYRYDEMLGAVWREPAPSRAGPDERTILLAALQATGDDGRAVVAELVDRSSLTPEDWLVALFEAVTVPLYHLLCRYGVGLVAHGQNVGLVLDEARPDRAIVKDFHGDLRLVDRSLPELETLDETARDAVKRLRPSHLLLDLVTGHMVTTLRFISPLVEDQLDVPETRFYALLRETLQRYMDDHPDLEDRYEMFPLLSETLEKVCVNRARFQAGFGDTADRPEPRFGTPIPNPLLSEA